MNVKSSLLGKVLAPALRLHMTLNLLAVLECAIAFVMPANTAMSGEIAGFRLVLSLLLSLLTG